MTESAAPMPEAGKTVGSNMAVHLSRRAGQGFDLGGRGDHELADYWARKAQNTRIYDLQSWFVDAAGKPAHICRAPMPVICDGEVTACREDIALQARAFVVSEHGSARERVIFRSFYLTNDTSLRSWLSRDRVFFRARSRLLSSIAASTLTKNAITETIMRAACIHRINSRTHLASLLERTLSLLCAIATEPEPLAQANNAGDTQTDLIWSEMTKDTGLYAGLRTLLRNPIHYLPSNATEGFQLIRPAGDLMLLANTPLKKPAETGLIQSLIPGTFPAMATP